MVNLAINLPGGKVVLTSSWRRACQEHWLKCRVEKPRAGMESRVGYRVGQKCEWVQNGQRYDTRRVKNETLLVYSHLLSTSLLVHFLVIFSRSVVFSREEQKIEIFVSRGFRCFLPSVTFSRCNKRAGARRAIKPCTRIRGIYAASTLEARRAGRTRLFWKLR